ncbi:hypothetical protein KMW28_24765 [Flammeovirga yaeyamensis]|uniref:Uncharacterized protein n=1 Tax=Flammeovirga yaeyamensis TaxID=367791 RepID=A0AAX1NCG6_9BACT|nr:hypothetical protein [Flammeovirga yaeyamensis]MBB3699498.1 hypothetical protein [Flammeovirga yaeyamensis]NMF35245.1 hypothetical protein [Flammeovirga yaeyamensis]QWG04106.1 hypothetical protein KMW28_24765 [Flammeovirga yaeyamensis]
MSTWDTESDDNIDEIIKEQKLFLQVGDFDSDSAVDSEFSEIEGLAMEVRNLTIAEDAIKIAADAAAVASIWSFGLGMAAFAALEASAIIDQKIISNKSKKLNEKLQSADTDISKKINPNVENYVAQYKQNNNLIVSKAPKGLDTKACRANLMQFMASVQRKAGKLDAATFKTYAESARIIYNSEGIDKVYDALDELNLSGKTEADVQKFMNTLVGWTPPPSAIVATELVRGMSLLILKNRLNVATKTIETTAREAGIPVEEVGVSAFEAMDAVGKFAAAVVVVMSVVDVVFNILDIVHVVEQCKKMCSELENTIKPKYKEYFNGIKSASIAYKAAITPSTTSWKKVDNVAEYGGASWNNHVKTITGTTVEAAKQYAESNSDITFFFFCKKGMYLDKDKNFNANTAVFFSGTPWYGSAPQCDSYEKTSVVKAEPV